MTPDSTPKFISKPDKEPQWNPGKINLEGTAQAGASCGPEPEADGPKELILLTHAFTHWCSESCSPDTLPRDQGLQNPSRHPGRLLAPR